MKLRVEKVRPDQALTPMNCRLMLGDQEIEGVTAVRFGPIDARKAKIHETEIVAEVEFERLDFAVMGKPWNAIVRAELERVRDELCPLGCGDGRPPTTTPFEDGLFHAFGRCPAEFVVRRLKELDTR